MRRQKNRAQLGMSAIGAKWTFRLRLSLTTPGGKRSTQAIFEAELLYFLSKGSNQGTKQRRGPSRQDDIFLTVTITTRAA